MTLLPAKLLNVCLPCVPPQDCQGEIQELWGDQDSWTSSWDSWCCACGTWWDCISWSPLSTLYSLSFILLRILDHIWSIVTVLFDLFNPNLLMCYSCNTGMSRNTLQARLIAFKSDNLIVIFWSCNKRDKKSFKNILDPFTGEWWLEPFVRISYRTIKCFKQVWFFHLPSCGGIWLVFTDAKNEAESICWTDWLTRGCAFKIVWGAAAEQITMKGYSIVPELIHYLWTQNQLSNQ